MGLLTLGTPLSWTETKAHADHVKEHGVQQFINHYQRLRQRTNDPFKWGDEMEYMIVKIDHENKKSRISLRGSDLLKDLLGREQRRNESSSGYIWHPEYAEYMLESLPGEPYGSTLEEACTVEESLLNRRKVIQSFLEPDEYILTLTNFPRLGCPDFVHPAPVNQQDNPISHSLYFHDSAIRKSHPRWKTFTRNIRERRAEKVAINVPIYQDVNTVNPLTRENYDNDDANKWKSSPIDNHIYMDAMGFGSGMCCGQVTFQAKDIMEARILYDNLTPLCPIMLAMTAATPVFRGMLSNVDCRWDVICQAKDDRTREERGLDPLFHDKFVIPTSRHASVDCYISPMGARYNDVPIIYEDHVYQKLVDGDIDETLAKHVAHLFNRDPVLLYSEILNQDDEKQLDHFENINSSNWQSMRFKLPPSGSDIGWRVEFRTCEAQITDWENAAVSVFLMLLARTILFFKLNLLIPITKINENMMNSQCMNAVMEKKFWFGKNIFTIVPGTENELLQLTCSEIFNGKGDDFVGLITLVDKYINCQNLNSATMKTLKRYLKFISDRAAGETITTAKWIRQFITSHPDYQQDSLVNDKVQYDLIVAVNDIANGKQKCPELNKC